MSNLKHYIRLNVHNTMMVKTLFTLISLFTFLDGFSQVFSERQGWDGPYDIRSIAAPNLQAVYVKSGTGSVLQADSLVRYATMLKAETRLDINNRYKEGNPFLTTGDIPLSAFGCDDVNSPCLSGFGTPTITPDCPGGEYPSLGKKKMLVSMTYSDYDADNSTFSSSMANLDIPSCSRIEAAYLYWTGDFRSNEPAMTLGQSSSLVPQSYNQTGDVFNVTSGGSAHRTVKFKIPNGNYVDVTATETFVNGVKYVCVANVTNQVLGLTGGGNFWVANIRGYPNQGDGGSTSGWTLVTVFSSPLSSPRSITLWDGMSPIDKGEQITIPLTGFQAPATTDFKSYVGFASLDGENIDTELNGATPETIDFTTNGTSPRVTKINPFCDGTQPKYKRWRQGFPADASEGRLEDNNCGTPLFSGAWAEVCDGVSSGRITSYNETTKRNGDPIIRLPSNPNTLGYDSHHFLLPDGAVASNATSASLTVYAGPQGGTVPFMAYIAIERLQPKLVLTKQADRDQATPGDVRTYTLKIKNEGNQNSFGGDLLTDTLDPVTKYLTGSLTARMFTGGVPANITLTPLPITNVAPDKQGLGFTIPIIRRKDSLELTFRVNVLPLTDPVAGDYYQNKCKRTIENVAWIDYKKNTASERLKSKSNSGECNDGSEVIIIITGVGGTPKVLNPIDASSYRTDYAVKNVRKQIFLQGHAVAADTAAYIVYDAAGNRVYSFEKFPTTGGEVTYTAYRDLSGPACQDIISIKFTFCPTLTSPAAPTVPAVCVGNTTTLSATGTPLEAFFWYANANGGLPNTNGFTTPPINTNTTFYLIDSNATTGCKSLRVPVVVTTKPGTNPGAIGTAISICSGATFNLTETNAASGGDGTFTYKWLSSPDNVTFTVIGGATAKDYTSPGVTANTYFAREVSSGGCKPDTGNAVLITILPGLDAGIIGSDATICYNGSASFTSTTLATGGNGTYAYQWISSTDGTNWTPIASATNITYSASSLTATTQFKRTVISGTGNCNKDSTLPVIVMVYPNFTGGGTIQASNTIICSGETVNLTNLTLPTGGTGSYTYTWSQTNGVTNSPLSSTTADGGNNTLTASVQTVFTFTRTATSGSCGSQTATVQVTVNPLVDFSVVLDPVSDICASDPNAITFTATPTPADIGTTGTYQWTVGGTAQISTTNTLSKLPNTLTNGSEVVVTLLPSAEVCPSTTPATTALTLVVATEVIPTISMPTPPAACEGTPVTFTATATGEGPSPSYVWTVTGPGAAGAPAASNTTTYTYNASNLDRVSVTVTTSSNCKSADPLKQTATATVDLTMKQLVTPTVVISADKLNPCENEPVTFNVTTKTNEGTLPSFAWYVGSQLQSSTTETFQTTTLSGNPSISVQMTSNAECIAAGTNPATSNALVVTVSPRVAPNTGIFADPGGTICAGQSVTFSASLTPADTANGGGAVKYEWYVGNSGVLGSNPTFTTAALANNDVVMVKYISSVRCLVNDNAVAAKQMTIKVNAPVVTITGTSTFCSDDNAGFLTAVDNGSGTDLVTNTPPTFSWTTLAGTSTGTTINQNVLVDGETVIVTMNPGYVCSGAPASDSQLITIYKKPVTGVNTSANEICPNGTATLIANGGTIAGSSLITYTWFRDRNPLAGSTPQVDISEGGTYTVRITNGLSNCFSEASQVITIQQVVVDAGPDKSMYQGESVVLEGTSNGPKTYSWTPARALSDSTIMQPTATPMFDTYYTIKAISSIGCEDTDEVLVQVFVPIRVPNAFSPNGDGKNDAWVIDGMEKFPTSKVNVYNRWGTAIYTDNAGYMVPWDGSHNGTSMPIGTYYYVIDLKGSPDNTDRSLTGSLTIVK